MLIIGLTGSIGMGKSVAAEFLRGMGVPVHDADAAVHRLLGPGGGAVEAVAEKFPGALRMNADGKPVIDRQALGQVIFADEKQKRALEAVLHPLVRRDSDVFLAAMKKESHPLVALDIPLLFETNGEGRVDAVICVTAPHDIQRARVLARPGMTEEKFERILKSQMPDAEKRERAHHVVDTGVSPEETQRQLRVIVDSLLKR